MSSRNKFSEEELRAAANEVLKYELAIFDSYVDYPDHMFRGEFRLKMATLLHDAKRGTVKTAEYSMGFAFYAKRCIAAVLLIFTLTCIAMPETVMAGYQKLIEVIETVFEEYTEYRYRVNDVGGIEERFRPLKLGYLPDGMEQTELVENNLNTKMFFLGKEGEYLRLVQKNLNDYRKTTYHINTEDAEIKEVPITNGDLMVISRGNRIYYIWIYKNYCINGQTNLHLEELLKILNCVEL